MRELTEDEIEHEVVDRLRAIQATMYLHGGDVEIEKLRLWTVERLLATCFRNQISVVIWPAPLEVA